MPSARIEDVEQLARHLCNTTGADYDSSIKPRQRAYREMAENALSWLRSQPVGEDDEAGFKRYVDGLRTAGKSTFELVEAAYLAACRRLRPEVERLRGEVGSQRSLLVSLEWAGERKGGTSSYACCPVCREVRYGNSGHTPDCQLAAALRKEEPKPCPK